MSERVIIPTERECTELRQLVVGDAKFYFDAVDNSREHLTQFGGATALNYPTLTSIKNSIVKPSDSSRLRMGIWSEETFVGSVNLTPRNYGAEVGYWIDLNHIGNGYATISCRAISAYANRLHDLVFARVVSDNHASVKVLEKSGYELAGLADGYTNDDQWLRYNFNPKSNVFIGS